MIISVLAKLASSFDQWQPAMGNGKVYATVALIRLIYAGMHILTKASFNEGASTTVFVFYRHAVAAIFLLPFAYFLEIRYS